MNTNQSDYVEFRGKTIKVRTACVQQRTASFEVKKSLEQFLAEQISVRKEKSKSVCYEWDKMQLKKSDLEAKAQGEDMKRATSCCLTRNEARQNIASLHFVFLGSS